MDLWRDPAPAWCHLGWAESGRVSAMSFGPREPELVRYEKVVQVVVQHIEVFCCDFCGAKYKEFTTKCPNCGSLLSGRKETL
jgi:hypothetical protein